MLREVETTVISLGNEPFETLGFDTQEELEIALCPLMTEIMPAEVFNS
tara:strand:+ start:64 stop:207 length:144 start_codon:yes stop_codon:yes gene_type:complete